MEVHARKPNSQSTSGDCAPSARACGSLLSRSRNPPCLSIREPRSSVDQRTPDRPAHRPMAGEALRTPSSPATLQPAQLSPYPLSGLVALWAARLPHRRSRLVHRKHLFLRRRNLSSKAPLLARLLSVRPNPLPLVDELALPCRS